MELRWEQDSKKYLYSVLCVLIAVSALLPVACDYIMSGGIITEWIARIEELTVSPLQLFPSAEVFMKTGIKENAMDSNLWFFFPGFLYKISGSLVIAYRIFMFVVQVGTIIFSQLFFSCYFSEKETKFCAFFGILLYMTCPYRIYVCYDRADFSATIVWMLLPLYAWAVLRLLRSKKPIWAYFVIAALALSGVGYADIISFFVLIAITVFTVIYFRKMLPVVVIAASGIMLSPVLHRLSQYLFSDMYQSLGLPVQSIMSNGYRIGQFFNTYAFREGHPGMGLGMLGCLLAGLWLWFVGGNRDWTKSERFMTVISLIFIILSTRYFPWDFVQRLGIWAMKLVALINTPAVFCGMAWGCLCIPAAASVDRITGYENKIISFYIPLIVFIACLGVCVYQCNTLTYSRLPLELR